MTNTLEMYRLRIADVKKFQNEGNYTRANTVIEEIMQLATEDGITLIKGGIDFWLTQIETVLGAADEIRETKEMMQIPIGKMDSDKSDKAASAS